MCPSWSCILHANSITWVKNQKVCFKDPVTFIVALSSREEVDRLPAPICSQQNPFYVSFSAREEKEATQSRRYSTLFRKAEEEVGDKGSWLQEFVTPKEESTGRSKLELRIVRACEGESHKTLLILIKNPSAIHVNFSCYRNGSIFVF